jgi:6-pyruvoyl-tetrahydropterin synthase
MGNSNEIVAKNITEEEIKEMFLDSLKEKLDNIYWTSNKNKNNLEYYYERIYNFNYLNKFLEYNTYNNANDNGYRGRLYRVAMANYIYKWYSNSI